MPHILMIATGGTIACCETAHGLSPSGQRRAARRTARTVCAVHS